MNKIDEFLKLYEMLVPSSKLVVRNVLSVMEMNPQIEAQTKKMNNRALMNKYKKLIGISDIEICQLIEEEKGVRTDVDSLRQIRKRNTQNSELMRDFISILGILDYEIESFKVISDFEKFAIKWLFESRTEANQEVAIALVNNLLEKDNGGFLDD